MKKYLSLLAFCALLTVPSQAPATQPRWTIANDHAIRWTVDGSRLPHNDHVEMSGEQISARLHYGVESDGRFTLTRTLVWPMLRMLPNDTFGGLTRDFPQNFLDAVRIDGKALAAEQVEYLRLDGLLTVVSRYGDIEVTRCLFPSPARAAFCEQYTLRNDGPTTVAVELNPVRDEIRTDADAGVEGSYTLIAATDFVRSRTLRLAPGETCIFGASVRGLKTPEVELPLDISAERAQREAFVAEVCGNLSLESPEPVLNTMFALAKVRAAESVFRTRGGLLHAPGGVYYAAIWCNDQPEYVNPFFPQLGYAKGNEAALNSFLHFARYMNPEYRYIPWSVIAEGYDTYGPFDRGDAAMLAYGAGRYALQMGDIRAAEALWPLIEWTLEYCRRKLNEHGVVASEADELEKRFPAGDANLCTSSLYYDALRSAAWLAEQTGRPQRLADEYRRRAETLRENIERFFGATVEGYATYRYYEGNDILRSWICIPLVTDIFERREATVAALLSPRLWTENGMLTAAGSDTFWDRTTLYALRGIYAAGFREEATECLRFYSQTRLLGEHVPYAVEAWPEGDQRHLSAESGLYCRIVTEGMFGFRPTGFRSFTLTPQLPDAWNQMALRRMYACAERPYDIVVKRAGKKLHVRIERDGSCIRKYTADNGTTIRIEL